MTQPLRTPGTRSTTAGLNPNGPVHERMLRERIGLLGSEVGGINAPGGAATAGMTTRTMGPAASRGRFPLSSGTPDRRYALPPSRIMMHQPSAGRSLEQDADRERWSTAARARDHGVVDHVVDRASQTPNGSGS